MQDRTWFLGPIKAEAKWHLFAASDCFALSSVQESFGIAAAEAVIAGVPIVVPNTAGVAGVVTPELGEVVPRDDRALADAISRQLDRRVGQDNVLARPELRDDLSWANRGKKLAALYREMVSDA
jgi:glycogen(starch) synthase